MATSGSNGQSSPSVTKSKIRKGVESVVVSAKSATKVIDEEKKKTTPVKTGGDETSANNNCSVTLRQSASFAKSDNFNKYKTASSVKQLHHRVSYSDLARNNSTRGSSTRPSTKRHTVDSVCIPSTTSTAKQTTPVTKTSKVPSSSKSVSSPSSPEPITSTTVSHNRSTLKFPQIATTAGGAKIHWPKREDILETSRNRRRSLELQNSATTVAVTMIKETEAKESLNTKLIAKTESKPTQPQKETQEVKMKDAEEILRDTKVELKVELSKVPLEPLIIMSQTGPATMKTEEGGSSRSATPSSISLASNTVSTSRTDSPRKINHSTRKASFKTHSGQSQSIRKLAVGSKVAALTHRFNQLIQTDATIMEEVKRKGVLVHRMNGHVYKIKEDPATAATALTDDGGLGKRKSLSRTASNADQSSTKHTGLKRRKSSVKKHDPLKKSSSNSSSVLAQVTANGKTNSANEKKGVKATIELFEPGTNSSAVGTTKTNQMKPKVPDKSENVLRRTKELVSNRRDREEAPSRMSLRLDEIKEVTEEKALTPIQETLPPIPSTETTPVDDPSMGCEMGKGTLKKDKSVYGRIYEKLKINKSSFLYAKKAPAIPTTPVTPTLQISKPVLNSSTYDLTEPVPLPPEQKIFEALESVDRKIENLYKSSIELSFSDNDNDQQTGQNIRPNQSFLFRSTSNIKSPSGYSSGHQSSFDLTSPNTEPCAALNVSLIKSKTMSMDERNFPFICRASDTSSSSHSVSTSDLLTTLPSAEEDHPLETTSSSATGNYAIRSEYQEIINETDKLIRRMNEAYATEDDDAAECVPSGSELATVNSQPIKEVVKTECNYDLYEQITSAIKQEEATGDVAAEPSSLAVHDDEEESIYQTVTEVKSAIRQAFVSNHNPYDEASVNSYESCDNYEAIDELRRNYREEQKRVAGLNGSENGYEICEPPEPPPPRKTSTTTEFVAPQLPVPKRNKGPVAPVPKSTFYAPAPKEEPQTQELQTTTTHTQHSNRTDIFHSDHVYEENIYDTIKSSDNTSLLSNNYESISLIRGSTGLDKFKSGDNCYESLRGSTLTINQMNGGGNPGNKFGKTDYYVTGHGLRHSESVSTLSSDHKTNSIYGTTMHYGGSIAMNPGDRHSIAGTSSFTGSSNSPTGSDNEVYTKMKHPPSENGTSYSENSDEWVDISDGEGEAGEGVLEEDQNAAKHKLIM